MVEGAYECVVHLILQHKPRHHLKPRELIQSCRWSDSEKVLEEVSDRDRPNEALSHFAIHVVVQVVERPGSRSEPRGAVLRFFKGVLRAAKRQCQYGVDNRCPKINAVV